MLLIQIVFSDVTKALTFENNNFVANVFEHDFETSESFDEFRMTIYKQIDEFLEILTQNSQHHKTKAIVEALNAQLVIKNMFNELENANFIKYTVQIDQVISHLSSKKQLIEKLRQKFDDSKLLKDIVKVNKLLSFINLRNDYFRE